jgi:hypothetical protein
MIGLSGRAWAILVLTEPGANPTGVDIAPPPPDPGVDWVDDMGRTYDAMGDGTKAKFKASIDHHLLKGAHPGNGWVSVETA